MHYLTKEPMIQFTSKANTSILNSVYGKNYDSIRIFPESLNLLKDNGCKTHLKLCDAARTTGVFVTKKKSSHKILWKTLLLGRKHSLMPNHCAGQFPQFVLAIKSCRINNSTSDIYCNSVETEERGRLRRHLYIENMYLLHNSRIRCKCGFSSAGDRVLYL